MSLKKEELKKISAIIREAKDTLEIDPKTTKGMEIEDYYRHWNTRYKRVHRTIIDSLDNLIDTTEDGQSVSVNQEMLEVFHANMSRLKQGVESDKNTKKIIFPKDKKLDSDFKKNSKNFFPKILDIQKSFKENQHLKDPLLVEMAATPQELVDVSNLLLNRLDNLYTQTTLNSINGGSVANSLPKRRPKEGNDIGESIGKSLDSMHERLDILHDKEKDMQNRGVIVDNPFLIGKQLKAFKEDMITLKAKLDTTYKTIDNILDDTPEKNLLIDITVMKSEIESFENKFGKEFEKRIKVYEDALKIPQVKMQGPENASLDDVREQLRAAGVGGTESVDGLPISSTPGSKGRNSGGVGAA